MSKVLVIVAHCDDELLGCGCYMDKLIAEGNEVSVCCMTYYAPTREEDINKKMVDIHKAIGVKKTYTAPFVALSLRDGSQHIERVQFIEEVILDSECDVIITHNDVDLHKDHIEVHDLTMEAIRYYQRRPSEYSHNRIRKVMSMEIPCSGLWGEERFNPNMFVPTDAEAIERKINRVLKYDDVIRIAPHPRSPEVIMSIAQVRVAMCGVRYAEAFHVLFERED